MRNLQWSKHDFMEASSWLENEKGRAELEETSLEGVDPLKLNSKQTLCYNLVTEWVDKKLENAETKAFYLNLSGAAGCGKSFFLKCLSKYIKEVAPLGFQKIAAPTGTAAFQIDGTTLHSLFKLPVQYVKGRPIDDLNPVALREMQNNFQNTELLTIDEKSMIGLELLSLINHRLKELKPDRCNEPFGGVSIILMGDFSQLPPVGDKPLYATKKLNNAQATGSILYNTFNRGMVFTEIMRQIGDEEKEFRDILGKIAKGLFKEEDWKWLATRDFGSFSALLSLL